MTKFIYKAKASPSKKVEGVIIADSRSSAIAKLSQMGYTPLAVSGEKESSGKASAQVISFSSRIKSSDVTDFTRKLSDLLGSGFTVSRALGALSRQARNKAIKGVILDILSRCDAGESLSSALGHYPKTFPQFYVSMVRAGETGGGMENILKRLADFGEAQAENRAKILSALAYPVLMIIVGAVTIIVLMTFVIPKMMDMFSDMAQTLPLPTRMLLFISDILRNYWWALMAVIIVAAVIFKKICSSTEGRVAIDNLKLKIPLVGRFETMSETSRFARTLGTLLHNGVPILESLKIASDTIGNTMMRRNMAKAYESVKEGSGLAKGLAMSAIIPEDVISMAALGEESGSLDKSLLKIAESYEREMDRTVKMMMSLMEPAMILVLGGIVGFIVISMLLPIFEVNFLVR
ncbi:MAG: type II secretion system F family protein [Candidatus Omnitrophica bacterium]|nr:type II secretion system F family protein [Candidatus Omnitrophota bacterium]